LKSHQNQKRNLRGKQFYIKPNVNYSISSGTKYCTLIARNDAVVIQSLEREIAADVKSTSLVVERNADQSELSWINNIFVGTNTC